MKEMSTKDKIIKVAWSLFDEYGYDNTTVDRIIQTCGISKGSFYHHFSSKDDLLGSLAYVFDSQYEIALEEVGTEEMNSYDKLIYFSEFLFRYIEENIPMEILSIVYSTQVIKSGKKFLLDHSRLYYKVLSTIIKEGQAKGDITDEKSQMELVRLYALQERAVLYDWCISEGMYPLSSYGIDILKFCTSSIKNTN